MGRPGLGNHPKFRRAMCLLSETRAHVRGHLELLWEVAYECGKPEIGDAADVELAADWQGEPGKLCQALLQCGGKGHAGFIEDIPGEPGRYQVHDLYDHAPEYVRKRVDRELARQRIGKTLSEIRAEAGRRGAAAKWTDGNRLANGDTCHNEDGKRMANDGKRLANGTPPVALPYRSRTQKKKPAGAGDIPVGLLELIDGWNALGTPIVRKGNGARRDPPAKAILSGWHRASKNPEQRQALENIPALLTAIRGAKFCHGQGWFTLPWLFGSNKNHEFNVCRLMAGAYDGANGSGKPDYRTGPGQVFDPAAPRLPVKGSF